MFNYSKTPLYPIEDVSYEINILGVKASVLPHIFGIMMGCLFLGSAIGILALPLFLFIFVGSCVLASKSFSLEQRGKPIEYSSLAQNLHKSSAFMKILVPSLEAVQHKAQRKYRE